MQTEILEPVSDPAEAPRNGPRKVGSIAGTVAGIVEEFYPWNSFKIFGDEVAQIFRSRYEVKDVIRGRDVPEQSEAKISKEQKAAIFDQHASKMEWTLVGAAL
ncbi:MAG: hypothetical protein U1E97_06805 [Alphaproteobacteria bacterium]